MRRITRCMASVFRQGYRAGSLKKDPGYSRGLSGNTERNSSWKGLFGFGFHLGGAFFGFSTQFFGLVFYGVLSSLRTALNGAACAMRYVTSGIFGIIEGLANVSFAGFGYHFDCTVVTNLYIGRRRSLSESGGGECRQGEEQRYFFHGFVRKKKGLWGLVRGLQAKGFVRLVPSCSGLMAGRPRAPYGSSSELSP